MCVDYHILNSLLPRVDKAHSKAKGILTLVPIPKIDEIYAKLEGSTIYSTFDMCSGYYHLELTPESQAKSAFVVRGPRGGKWEFKRCPFGLTQAPAYFQLLVSKVIEGLPFALDTWMTSWCSVQTSKNIWNMLGYSSRDSGELT